MKIYFETYGCASNKADEDVMRTMLKEHEIVDNADDAELIIVLSCGVKGSTENKILNRLNELKTKNVLVGGCLTKILNLEKKYPKFSFIGPDQVADIAGIVHEIESGEIIVELSAKKCKHVIQDVFNETQAINIALGCLGNCAYCATKIAKGNLQSHKIEDIIASVKKAVSNGAKKILLTAQDTGCYGFDIGTNLPELLKEVVKIEGDFEVRVGMMNPVHVMKIVDDLIDVYQNSKIIKFIHIPVQAGNNDVLKAMNRGNTVEEFEELVKKLRRGIHGLIVSTDIICGFPGETEEQFQETIELVKRMRPEMINFSKFYPRPGTKAKEMKNLPNNVVKDRSRRFFDIVKQLRKT